LIEKRMPGGSARHPLFPARLGFSLIFR